MGRVVRFVATVEAQPTATAPAPTGLETIVIDATWTPAQGDSHDLRPLRPLVLDVLRERDPSAESLRLLDRWAAESDIAPRLEVDGFSWWYRRRLVYWRGLQDRLIWRWILGRLAAEGAIARLELTTDVAELRDVAGLLAGAEGWAFEAPPPFVPPPRAPRRRLPWPIDPMLWRLGFHPAQRGRSAGPSAATVSARTKAMLERLRGLDRERGRLLVLTAPATHQSIATGAHAETRDPFLGPVVDSLRGTSLEPVLLEIGSSVADEATWARLQSPGHDRVLPASILGPAFSDPADDAGIQRGRRQVHERIAGSFPRLESDGLDLGPWIVAGLRDYVGSGLASELRRTAGIGRFLATLGPAAILMINEYSRPEWLIAGARRGIPVVAVQHGIIHPLHAGYVLPSRVGLPLADKTHLFGEYEARLLTEASVYDRYEVAASGAPRLDLVPGAPSPSKRAATRARLGVAPNERLVVFSSTSSVAVRATIIAATFEAILDRAWPDVHLVVKLHPSEDDGSFYPRLIEGIARARGFPPPRTTIVKSIDLFELLRAADAHLGVHSTVLTDAVAAGTPNLIVTSLAGSDLIGYVAAGVARPVRNGADLVAALGTSEDPGRTAAARAAFLADHFAAGPSGRRIADDLLARHGQEVAPPASEPAEASALEAGSMRPPIGRRDGS
jgi:hypothetical protein